MPVQAVLNHGMVHEMTEGTWDNVMYINIRSVSLGMQVCLQSISGPAGPCEWS